MTRWLILLIALTSVSCASQPIELPDWDLAARQDDAEVADPIVLPMLWEIPSTGVWPVECWKALDAYDIAAQANYEAAALNANALRQSERAYDSLIEAGKLQSQLAQIREEMLERERRDHTADNWFYRVIITLGLIGAAAL